MNPACPFCGSDTELDHDGGSRPGITPEVPPVHHWRQCVLLTCRARGPRACTPEGANLAFLERPEAGDRRLEEERSASISPPASRLPPPPTRLPPPGFRIP